MMMDELIRVTTTSDDVLELEKIAARLIERRLAACCQISGPINSWYIWDGKTESTQEWVCAIKTVSGVFSDVVSTIEEMHHYDEPQIVGDVLPLASEGYRQWIIKAVLG